MGKYQKNIEAARRITVMQYLETYHPGELVRKTDREYLLKDIYKHEFLKLDGACARAMTQIHDRRYSEYLRNEGRNDIWAYGIAFFKKRCKVVAEKLK